MEKSPRAQVLTQIKRFNDEIVLPAFLEMKPNLERDNKRVTVVDGMATSNKFNQEILEIMHPKSQVLSNLRGDYLEEGQVGIPVLGHTLIVEEIPPEQPPDAGRFFYSIVFNIQSPEVFANPVIMYYMNFNGKFHKFMHRFDQKIEKHRISDINKYHILNHFLNSFDYYRIYRKSATRPSGFY